jgi:hypothetical protein
LRSHHCWSGGGPRWKDACCRTRSQRAGVGLCVSRQARNMRPQGAIVHQCVPSSFSLAVPIWSDPALTADVAALAKHIAGTHPSPQVVAYAQQVTDAQIDVVRVRRWWLDLMKQHLASLRLKDPDDSACELRCDPEVPLRKALILSALTPELQ